MKTITTLFAILFSINLMIAQPVVKSNILLNIGDERIVSYAETAFNPGDAGADKTWDFSNVPWSYNQTWLALDPDSTGFADLFPGADLAFKVPKNESDEFYTDSWVYYDVADGEEISLLGAVLADYSSGADTSYFFLNDDPDLLFEFPLAYFDQFSDDIAGTNLVYNQGQLFELERTGTTTTKVDGYGTLITPKGTFENVLRVKRTEDITDMYLGFPTYQEIVRYTWFSPVHDYLLYQTEEIIIKNATGGEVNRSTQTWYAEAVLISGIANNIVETFTTYPNPCKDVLYLPNEIVNRSAKIEIFNMHGKNIYSEHEQNPRIDVSWMQPGVYIVVITGLDGKHYHSQIIVT